MIHWQGNQIITLGTEGFKWFENYASKEDFNEFWSQGDQRYQKSLNITIKALDEQGKIHQKKLLFFLYLILLL